MDELKKRLRGRLREREPLSQYSTLKIGGAARYLTELDSAQELAQLLKLCAQAQIPYLLIGGGSNLLISDQGFEGLVIKYSCRGIEEKNGQLVVQAGTSLQQLVDYTIEHGLSGLHKMIGIPGTVGGAVYGNAGAYGQMIGDHIVSVQCLSPEGEVLILSKIECGFGYRESNFSHNGLTILEVAFSLPPSNSVQLRVEAQEILKLRAVKYQPGVLCPGSFFRNLYTKDVPPEALRMLPPRKDTFGKTPAYLFLEGLGAKGDRLGQIQIAPYHANLFINLGGGTARDFYRLAKKWHQKVWERYGVNLQPEVQLINLPSLGPD